MLLLLFTLMFTELSVADDLPNGWRLIPLPGGGELRFLPPRANTSDYPRKALLAGIQGRTILRLVISPSGEMLDCKPVQSAGNSELDRRACQLYRTRAQFKLKGVSQPQTFQAPIEWWIE